MNFRIEKDGSIDLFAGKLSLAGGYPAADGKAFRPLSVTVSENEAVYVTKDGELTVSLCESEGTVILKTKVSGFENCHDLAVLSQLSMEGGTKLFKQGKGLGGPTKFCEPTETFDSDAVFAYGDDESCVTLHVEDQRRFRSHFTGEKGELAIVFDLEKCVKEETVLPDVYITEGADFGSALHACALGIAAEMQARTPKDPAFHWCSWYYLYHNLDQKILEDYLAGFSKYRDIAPYRYIQIDAGYFPSCGDWLIPNERFPEGLGHAADTIKAAGYEPGIWIAPFMVGDHSALYREHPDWVLKGLDGKPLNMWKQYNEPKVWGYIDSNYYALDTSHPDAMDYMKNVFETLYAYGYRLYKTDFMLWGLQDSAQVIRHTPGKTSFEYFREFMQVIREAIHDSEWLGCIAPFMPFLGYADRMRIGGDVGAQWNESDFGPVNMMQEILGDQYFNNVYWQNDPDAVLLRDFDIYLKDHEIEALALLQALSGGVITTSDPVHEIGDSRKKLLKLICPKGVAHPSYPYWQEGRKEIVITNTLENGSSIVFIMNPTTEDRVFVPDWEKLAPQAKYAYLLHGGSVEKEKLHYITVPAHGAVLCFMTEQALEKEPDNLWEL